MHPWRKGADFEAFEHDAIEALRGDPIRILSYSALSNHWHFVVLRRGVSGFQTRFWDDAA
jgi:hypothetical protein